MSIVLSVAVLWSLPFGIFAIEEGADVFYSRHNTAMFLFNLRLFGMCFAALIWPWVALLALWLLQRKPRWVFYSAFVLAVIGGAWVGLMAAGIGVMENLNLGP